MKKRKLFVLVALLSATSLVSCGEMFDRHSEVNQNSSLITSSSLQGSKEVTSVSTNYQTSDSSEEVSSSTVVVSSDRVSSEDSSTTSIASEIISSYASVIINEDSIGTLDSPGCISDSVDLALSLEEGKDEIAKETSYVKGLVKSLVQSDKNEKQYKAVLVDAYDSNKELIVYFGTLSDDYDAIYVGDVVTVEGKLQNYYKTPEIVNATYIKDKHLSYNVSTSINEHGTIVGLNEEVLSGTSYPFEIKVEEGYKIEYVKVNGSTLKANDDVYVLLGSFENNIEVSIIPVGQVSKTTVELSITDALNMYNENATNKITKRGDKVNELYTGDSNVTIKSGNDKNNNGKVYGTYSSNKWSDADWRFYGSDKGKIVISCTYDIVSVSITYSGGGFTVNNIGYTSDMVFNVGAKEVTFEASGKPQIKNFVVVYTAK